MQDERWLTPSQVADRLQVSLDTVLRLLRAGALPGGRIGRQWRIRPTDLEHYLSQHRNSAGLVALGRAAGAEA